VVGHSCMILVSCIRYFGLQCQISGKVVEPGYSTQWIIVCIMTSSTVEWIHLMATHTCMNKLRFEQVRSLKHADVKFGIANLHHWSFFCVAHWLIRGIDREVLGPSSSIQNLIKKLSAHPPYFVARNNPKWDPELGTIVHITISPSVRV